MNQSFIRPPGAAREAALIGAGAVSAYGLGVEAFWQGLLSGRSGIGAMPEALSAYTRCAAAAVVEAPLTEEDRPHAQRLSRATTMALAAAREAQRAQPAGVPPARIGVVVGAGLGNLDLMDAALRDPGARLSPALAFQSYAHAAACEVSRALGARGPLLTVSTGCNSGADAIGVALDWLRLGKCDLVYAGGTEAELVPAFLQAMGAARALQSRHNATPAAASRPFDAARDGNVPGEGAAFLLLAAPAAAVGVPVWAELVGAANCAFGERPPYDPFRPLPDPSGMLAALTGAIADAGLTPEDIGLVSANGSSSVFYDVLEAQTIRQALPARTPVWSMKGALGQTGAVTPVLQALAAALTLRDGQCPPTLNCPDLDPACGDLALIREPRSLSVRHVLTNAIGFGGYYYATQVWRRDDG